MSSNKENQAGVNDDDVSNEVANPINSDQSSRGSSSSSGIQEVRASQERANELKDFQQTTGDEQPTFDDLDRSHPVESPVDDQTTLTASIRDSDDVVDLVSDAELISISDASTLSAVESFEMDADVDLAHRSLSFDSDSSDDSDGEQPPRVVQQQATGAVSSSNKDEDSDGKAWYYTKEEVKEFFLSQNAQYDDEDLEELLQESTSAETLRLRLGITDVRIVCGIRYYEMKPDNYVNMPLSLLNKCLVCVLCCGYLIDPITMSVCGHNFCRFCVDQATKNPTLCPLCEYTGDAEANLQKRIPNEGLANLVYTFFPGLKNHKHESQHPKEHMRDEIYLRPGIKMTGLGYATLKFKLDKDTTMAQVAIFLNRQIENSNDGAHIRLTHHGEEVNPFKTVEEVALESGGNLSRELVFDYEV